MNFQNVYYHGIAHSAYIMVDLLYWSIVVQCFGGTHSHIIFRIHVQIDWADAKATWWHLQKINNLNILIFWYMTINNHPFSCENPYKCITILISNWNELLTKWRNVVHMTKSMSPPPVVQEWIISTSPVRIETYWSQIVMKRDCECVLCSPSPLLETHVRINNQLDMQADVAPASVSTNDVAIVELQKSPPLCHFKWFK